MNPANAEMPRSLFVSFEQHEKMDGKREMGKREGVSWSPITVQKRRRCDVI